MKSQLKKLVRSVGHEESTGEASEDCWLCRVTRNKPVKTVGHEESTGEASEDCWS